MHIRVPATSANLGPGFDALGLALTLYAEIGAGADGATVPQGAHLVDDHHPAMIAFRHRSGTGALWVRSPIPMGRGLGYSAAMRIGGLMAAHVQQNGTDSKLLLEARDDLLADATALEGHPDNAAPALLGGFVVAAGGHAIPVPLGFDPAVVCWVPSFTTATDRSRRRLAASVPFTDAVFNLGRAALLVAALATGDIAALRVATQDRLHQANRFAGSPLSLAAYEAAMNAGAWACWLSGSGPTVAALCDPAEAEYLAATLAADASVKILGIDRSGASIVDAPAEL